MARHVAAVALLSTAACGCLLQQHGSHAVADCSAMGLGVNGSQGLVEQLKELGAVESLTLGLRHDGLSEDLERLAEQLAKLTSLVALTISLDGNDIGDAGIDTLAEALRQLSGLESLTLSLQYNSIHAAGAGTLGAALAKIPTLRELDLELKFNSLRSAGAGGLLQGLRSLSGLRRLTLGLYSNGIESAGVADMTEALKEMNLQSLTLDFRYNEIDASGADALRIGLRQLTNLAELSVLPASLMLAPTTTRTQSLESLTTTLAAMRSEAEKTSSTTELLLTSLRGGPSPPFETTMQEPTVLVDEVSGASTNEAIAATDVSSALKWASRQLTTKQPKQIASEDASIPEGQWSTTLLSTKPSEIESPPDADAPPQGTFSIMLGGLLIMVVAVAGVSYAWVKLKSSAREYSNSLPQASGAAGPAQDDFDPNIAPAPQPAHKVKTELATLPDDDFNPNEPIRPLPGPGQSRASAAKPKPKPKSSLDALYSQSLSQL